MENQELSETELKTYEAEIGQATIEFYLENLGKLKTSNDNPFMFFAIPELVRNTKFQRETKEFKKQLCFFSEKRLFYVIHFHMNYWTTMGTKLTQEEHLCIKNNDNSIVEKIWYSDKRRELYPSFKEAFKAALLEFD
jgi:hypothetical protein